MKNIYFIRHAEAIHNPPVKKIGNKDILIEEKYYDAKLTEYGEQQCYDVQEKMTKLDLDIVYVSPLYRTLQTASILFQKNNVELKALEIIRERLGVRPCDRRHGKPYLEKNFKNISFDQCLEGYIDPLWKSNHRETEQELKTRISKFLKWIQTIPEENICIVTHQGFMLRLYKVLGLDFPAPDNCEIIKLKLK